MGKYITVSAKIPKELKEKIDRYGIKVGEVVREALELEVKKRMIQEARRSLKDLMLFLGEIPKEEVVRIIREDREAA